MMRRFILRSVAAVACLMLCVACGSGATATPTAVPTFAPQPTTAPTIVPTAAPTVTPTPQPAIQQGGAAEAGEPVAAGSLQLTGLVTTTLTLSPQDLAAYPQVDVPADVTGDAEGFSGPRLDDLLAKAGVQAAAQSVVFSTNAGTFVERPLDQIIGRFDVLVAIHADGRLQIIDPRLEEPVALDDVSRVEVR